MTLFEVCVVLAVVIVLVALLLPATSCPRNYAKKINCRNDLKCIGFAYRIWEGDNGDIYPMGISVTNGGSMEAATAGDLAQTWRVMSNELCMTKILLCPADADRIWATNFSSLANSNISYFVGVEVTNEANPRAILTGDSNFEMGGKAVAAGRFSFGTNDPIAWQSNRHSKYGNLVFADGSVQGTTASRLRAYVAVTGVATNRWAIP